MINEVKQYKCLTDLKDIIESVESVRIRPTPRGSDPIIYPERSEGRYRTVMGVRICDYKFSADERWVLPDDQMGLSFSGTWENLQFSHKMASRKKKPVDIFWVLSEADLPKHMKFEKDKERDGHYFLTVTKRIRIEDLVFNLKWISDRLSVIKEGGAYL
ncbi:hypothetical protein [Microbulbifer sp. TRSA007]|uniref:hypothetical protein n=1 Tax=Microbulbifer sp. TRSA007 TaxID=3243384 RepID=UPI0040396FB2